MKDIPTDSAVFSAGDFANLISGSDNESYGSAFANNLDWLTLGNSLMDDVDLSMPEWDEFGISANQMIDIQPAPDQSPPNLALPETTRQTEEPLAAPTQSAKKASLFPESALKTTAHSQRQIEIYEHIENLDSSIQDLELQDGDTREILGLKLEKARMRLELHQLRENAPRDKKMVSLLFEEAALQLEIMKLTCSPEDLEENEDYLQLRLQKVRLKKELDGLRSQPQAAEMPSSEARLGTRAMAATSSTQRQTGPDVDQNLSVNPEAPTQDPRKQQTPDSLEIVSVKRLEGGTATTFKLPSVAAEKRLSKKPKLSDTQIRNRRQVRAAGGQCLSCRSNRSKPACTGYDACFQCQADGLECIRPTLKDKNVFSARFDLLHQPSPSSSVASNSKKAFVAAIIRDFFDMSSHSFLERHPEVLGLLDKLYRTVVSYGFDEEISRSRTVALSGACAFNIFVKTNTVINNRHLKFIDDQLEESLREAAEIDVVTTEGAKRPLTQEEVEGLILSVLEVKKADAVRQLEVLRAISSEYVFLVLEEFLRESNIRDCKGYSNLAKKVSLLAALGLTLEQVLDFAESATRSKTLDSELRQMLRHLGLVLLSYLEPPSAVAFPEGVEINACFGKNSKDVTGVFFENTFWYELWKASSNAIPSHLLQVTPSGKPAADPSEAPNPCVPRLSATPKSSQSLREEYGDQVEAMSRNYMGMNLSFRRAQAIDTFQPLDTYASMDLQTPMPNIHASRIPLLRAMPTASNEILTHQTNIQASRIQPQATIAMASDELLPHQTENPKVHSGIGRLIRSLPHLTPLPDSDPENQREHKKRKRSILDRVFK